MNINRIHCLLQSVQRHTCQKAWQMFQACVTKAVILGLYLHSDSWHANDHSPVASTLNTKRHHACTCTQYRTVPDQLAIAMQRRCNDCINPFGNWTAWKEVTMLCCIYKLSASAQWLWVDGITLRQAGKHTTGPAMHEHTLKAYCSVCHPVQL